MKSLFSLTLIVAMIAVTTVGAATQPEADAAKVQAQSNLTECTAAYKSAKTRYDEMDVDYIVMTLRFDKFSADYKAGKLIGKVSNRVYQEMLGGMADAEYCHEMADDKRTLARNSETNAAVILGVGGDFANHYAIPDYDACINDCTMVNGYCQECGHFIGLMDYYIEGTYINMNDLGEWLESYGY
jgi:hypothetical protein